MSAVHDDGPPLALQHRAVTRANELLGTPEAPRLPELAEQEVEKWPRLQQLLEWS